MGMGMGMGFVHRDLGCLPRCNSILLSFEPYYVFRISIFFWHMKEPHQEMAAYHTIVVPIGEGPWTFTFRRCS